MGFWGWAAQNAFELLSAVGIIGGLIFTAVSLRSDARARRIGNLIALTSNHREIWETTYKHGDLSRILEPRADVAARPPTSDEITFVIVVIQHIACVHQCIQSDLSISPEEIRRDIQTLFSLPVPRAVWEHAKPLQNHGFANFVDGCIADLKS